MLKIKDEVDLKELEKFGFKENGDYYSKLVMTDGYSQAWTWYEKLIIDKDNKIIRTQLYNDCKNQFWFGYIEDTSQYLNELNKAGLVEKVGEKNE